MEKTLAKHSCWNCKFETSNLFFCSSCKALQALPEDTDYFRCLGLEVRLQIDSEQLEETYHNLSRKFHPDFYQKRSQEEQQVSLENAALLNKAYRTLKDPLERVTYLIGLVEGEDDIPLEAPSDLFEEIFLLQEALEDAKSLPPGASAKKKTLFVDLKTAMENLQSRQMESGKEIESLSAQWDMSASSGNDGTFTAQQMDCLHQMKKVLSHRAYLERMVKNIRETIEGK